MALGGEFVNCNISDCNSGSCPSSSTCGSKDQSNLGNKPKGTSVNNIETHKLNSIKRVIAVMSGKGGVGKSSVTAILASELNRNGLKVGILDADVTGPSIPKMFGIKQRPLVNQTGMYPSISNAGIKIMSVNLLLEKEDDPVIWRGPVISGAVQQFWKDVIWGELDYLLVDLPPGTGDVALTVMQSLPVHGVVIISSPQDLAHMVVRKAINMTKKINIPILGIVENMSSFSCPHCKESIEIFGSQKEVNDYNGIPKLGELPLDPTLSRMCDEGLVEFYSNHLNSQIVEKLLVQVEKHNPAS
jgi:Mrp family chromosome partitioning ATPase